MDGDIQDATKDNVVLFPPTLAREMGRVEDATPPARIFTDTVEGLRAIRAFMRIEDPAMRMVLIELMEKMGSRAKAKSRAAKLRHK